jgi:D-alanyl-D-alanine carboxypeptidase (penicillin-binding protein 5/6)
MTRNWLAVVAVSVLAVLVMARPGLTPGASASTIDTKAREAILLDFETGTVLFEKNADERMPPASMSKIMTIFLAFERIQDGRLSLDDSISISEKAWRKGGSKMFVELNSQVKVADILRGIIIQSGNDAAIALAEGLAGSEEAFAQEMTRRAQELGMTGSSFRNATGWPDPEHRMTARDLATLAMEIIRRFPDLYPIYSETSFTYNGIKQGNRNPLLYRSIGADGLKTGHTENAGYGLTASAVQDGRRLVLVVNGLGSVRERGQEAETLMSWGFREFENYTLLKSGEVVDEADVWLGDLARVPLVAAEDIRLTMRQAARREMNVTVEYVKPIPAPIAAGQHIATLRISAPDQEDVTVPLVAGTDVEKLGMFGRLIAAVSYLVFGAGG